MLLAIIMSLGNVVANGSGKGFRQSRASEMGAIGMVSTRVHKNRWLELEHVTP